MAHSLTLTTLSVTVALLFGLTAVAWRLRAKPGAKMFGVLQATSAIWVMLAIVGLQLPTGRLRLVVWGVKTGTSLIVVVLWLGFILIYTGRDHLLALRRFGIASVPLAIGAGLYFVVPTWAPLVGRVEQATIPAGTVVQTSVGPVGNVLGVYIYLFFLAGFGLVVASTLEGNSLFVGQATALVLGTLITVVASYLAIVGIPVKGYPVTEVALGGQSLLWGYAVFGQRFLQVVPAVATIGERTVFDEFDDPILVVDGSGTVTRANPPARSLFESDEITGVRIQPRLDRMGVSSLAELPTRFQSGSQTYRATTSDITNWRGETIGQAVMIQDVTQLVRRQQRLQVLTRILRHNVRNDMNVVLGMGERLREREEAPLTTVGETISEKADDLIEISEKAIELDRLFDSPIAPERLEVDATLDEIVSSLVVEHPDATVSTDVAVDTVRTDPRVLQLVLEEVLKNALEHTGDAPEVTVDVSRIGDRVRIAVGDDGPGIPRTEISPIAVGEETDLGHASSIGLWLVYWGTEALGGDVDVATTDVGSTVTVTVPDRDAAEVTAGTAARGRRTTGER